MVNVYLDSIKKLEERRAELFEMINAHIGCKADLLQRVVLIDYELADLSDIVSYLSSRVPRSNIFLE